MFFTDFENIKGSQMATFKIGIYLNYYLHHQTNESNDKPRF